MMRRLLLSAALLASATALPGCWVPLERGRAMESRLDRLEADSDAYNRQIGEQQRAVRERIAAVDKKIAEVQQKIDELNQAARRSGADLGVQVSRLQDEVTKLKGELEVQRHDLGALDQSVGAYRTQTDRRFAGLKGRGELDVVLAKEKIDALPKPGDRAAVLALAQKTEQDGDKNVAQAIYEEYARRWPEDANTAEATFRSAEILAAQQRWRDALVGYGWVYEHAPKSDRAPDAMLGMAIAMSELEDLRKDAPVVLEELVQKYPKSPAAAKAREQLKKLAPAAPERSGERKKAPARKK